MSHKIEICFINSRLNAGPQRPTSIQSCHGVLTNFNYILAEIQTVCVHILISMEIEEEDGEEGGGGE